MAPATSGKGTATRQQILLRAADLASAEGLESLTIGRLASALGMSKSGLFAHFGSKEELQLAVLETAWEVFAREVIEPARPAPRGLPRLLALVEAWLRHVEHPVFRGGCFFSAACAEYDDRPGRIRDRLVALTTDWLGAMRAEVGEAMRRGHIVHDTDDGQIAFELHAFLQEANWAYQLHGDATVFERARIAMRRTLASVSAPAHAHLLEESS
ncbi:MAG TPA: TetR/AcrR family transcriptional regulator [Candidatus Limnocylindrales bacterium]|nr:TetR/AcrR family transcriptional regulator [Candidatus Limnocylindrales bacterium]